MRNPRSNTFGQRSRYVQPIAAEGAAHPTQDCANARYVTSGNEADGHYEFTSLPPDEKRQLTASPSLGQGRRVLSSLIDGERCSLTDARTAEAFHARPLQTYLVTAGILREPLKLWQKGLTIEPRPRDGGHVPPAEEASR